MKVKRQTTNAERNLIHTKRYGIVITATAIKTNKTKGLQIDATF